MAAIPTDTTPHDWGGRSALALVNSLAWRRSGEPEDALLGYPQLAKLVSWSGFIQLEPLIAAAERTPDAAADEFGRAVAFREALYPVFSAAAANDPLPGDGLEALNAVLAQGLGQLQVSGGRALAWRDPERLELPRWAAAISAARVLAEDDPSRVKQCPGERCGWVFLDESRNRSRRWCDTTLCGNRERVKAHYARNHG